MVTTEVNEDLQRERKKCDFDVEELTNLLDGGASYTKKRREMESKVLSIEGLLDKVPEEYLSHEEKYENAIRKAVIYYRAARNLQDPNLDEFEKVRANRRSLLTAAVFRDNTPMSLHFIMFMPAILGQGTEEQKAYWMKRASNLEIIGTYAQDLMTATFGLMLAIFQTELGHGTFIRGLETTATYDPSTEEFILHSPTLTAYKWWPGNLGHTVNYCIVMAQLYSKGKKCGIQPFIVQIRDEETHMPLPGIKVGEIGAKMAFNTVNNGFLGFDHHRIPRNHMLMKNSQVLKDGTFISSPNNKLTYGTMVFVRVAIVNDMANRLGLTATIAVRYAAVRKQSQIKAGEPEPQILDYVTQQHKLFIAIASSYAFSLTASWLWDLFAKVNKDLAVGNTDDLPELHALACGLKATASTDASSMIEKCRLACGGHGFMLSSNLPQAYGLATAACTYEGENTVMMLQTARYLVKMREQALKGNKLCPSLHYMKVKTNPKWSASIKGIITSFQRVAFCKISSATSSMQRYVKAGLSPEDAWNKSSVQLVAAAEAHCRAVILLTFHKEVQVKASKNSGVKKVLNNLVELYAVYWSLERLGDLLLYTSITERDVVELRYKYETLLEQIRPNAVGLVDAFDFRDEILNSTLGAYDGRVYERLMEEALKSPLNKEPVNRSFHRYLKPFMQGKL